MYSVFIFSTSVARGPALFAAAANMLRISVDRSFRESSAIICRIWPRNASNFSAAVGALSGSEGFDGFGGGSRRTGGGGGWGSRATGGGGGGSGGGSSIGLGFGRSMMSGVEGFSGGGGGGVLLLCVTANIRRRMITPPTTAMIGSGLDGLVAGPGRRG